MNDLRKAIDHLERDFGPTTPELRRSLLPILQQFFDDLSQLRRDCNERARQCGKTLPSECSSCAFRTRPDETNGYPTTTYAVIRALLQPMRFYCHSNQPWLKAGNTVSMSSLLACTGFAKMTSFHQKRAYKLAEEAFGKMLRLAPHAPIARMLTIAALEEEIHNVAA